MNYQMRQMIPEGFSLFQRFALHGGQSLEGRPDAPVGEPVGDGLGDVPDGVRRGQPGGRVQPTALRLLAPDGVHRLVVHQRQEPGADGDVPASLGPQAADGLGRARAGTIAPCCDASCPTLS